MSSISSGSSESSSHSTKIPPVGAVRCYWALLTPRYIPLPPQPDGSSPGTKLELEFVHPDPVLGVHLAKQKLSMMGRGVIEFIHPHEREQARRDLLSAIASDDLQGSVTRVRFARLSRIRTILGCPPEENFFPADADKFAEDDEYIILDLVLNWVANGVLLAFFHAIKDKDPVANNDPRRSHEEWNNWCGTREMSEDQIEALQNNISARITPPTLTRYPPSRVFQLHYTEPPLDPSLPSPPPRLIFSWPPARPIGTRPEPDGLYNAKEFCEMMKNVDMDPSQLNAGPDELRTNCTTRYGAQHSITTEGVYRHVTSVFIPYGSLIFACFQTTRMYDLPTSHHQRVGEAVTTANTVLGGSGSAAGGSEWASKQPPSASTSASTSSSVPQGTPPPAQAAHVLSTWAHADSRRPDGDWPPASVSAVSSSGYPPTGPDPVQQDVSYLPPASSSYHPHSHAAHHGHSHGHPHSHSAFDDHLPASVSMSGQLSDGMPNGHGHPHGHSNGYSQSHPQPFPSHSSNGHTNGHTSASAHANAASSRPLVRPPGNVECCVMCGIRESPEWRRNESGIKDLCNACGLRLARQVAKREGRQKPRKKKDSTGPGSNSGSTRGESATKDAYGI
ncbi:hypothetical protein IAU60_006568 [Kwoniella sp. DSM 27419]